MDVGTALSAAQTLFAALQCRELGEMCSSFNYKSKLEDLRRTVDTVQAVLRDAEAKRDDLSQQQQLYIEELKDAVFDADDLVDEFLTLAERNKLEVQQGGRRLSEKLDHFFSHIKKLPIALSMSSRVKEIQKTLEKIAENHTKYGFKFDSQPIKKRREETCALVDEPEMIGREEDKEKIVGMLLSDHHPDGQQQQQDNVGWLSIVGMGGLGKTTLAQLVYNHPKIKNEFPMRYWVCVSDEGDTQLDVKSILAKILAQATDEKHEDLDLQCLHNQFTKKVAGRKYLLILDDVWTEDPEEWRNLSKYFKGSTGGSRIVVTTRSNNTANIVGNDCTYELEGLSEQDSWLLFCKAAFKGGETDQTDLIEIGQEIVQKCANVPLAIRVVGSLLLGQPKSKWDDMKRTEVRKIGEANKGILPILKFSYHHLESSLKNCFAYCAIFPKDYVIEKEMLINMWVAHDLVKPEIGQTIEDAGDENFSILLRRCFFQNVHKNEFGEIFSCQMHDLMHDIAKEVAGKEICDGKFSTSDSTRRFRHLSFHDHRDIKENFDVTGIRTFLWLFNLRRMRSEGLKFIFEKLRCLRVLKLRCSGKILPSKIGELLHLRYLDLSRNYILEELPNSITKLHNLQTLDLSHCSKLRELPRDMRKLVKLRVLNMNDSGITYLPLGLERLSCITLPSWRLGAQNSNRKQCFIDEVERLKIQPNLKGKLDINVHLPKGDASYVKKIGSEREPMRSQIKYISFCFYEEDDDDDDEEEEEDISKRNVDYEESLLEDLQPHPNVQALRLFRFGGCRMPSWGRDEKLTVCLPNLVSISLSVCRGLQHVDSLGKLQHLKTLRLYCLGNLEYMENSPAMETTYFPSLKELCLVELPELKGWWRDDGQPQLLGSSTPTHLPIAFPCLAELGINGCPKLTSTMFCPSLVYLVLNHFNERLQIIMMERGRGDENGMGPSSFSSSFSRISPSQSHFGNSSLRNLETDNIAACVKVVQPVEAFQGLAHIEIVYDELESLSEVKVLFQSCSSSLISLSIYNCRELRSISCEDVEHFAALEDLWIYNSPCLIVSNNNNNVEEDVEDGIPWRSLHNLHSLKLNNLPQLTKLPEGIQYLTALQSLKITFCTHLKSLSNSLQKLTCLKNLVIESEYDESHWRKRCENPTGADWPNIQHIPHVKISKYPTW